MKELSLNVKQFLMVLFHQMQKYGFKSLMIDNMGNSVEHEYLMTTGYLWTSQFPESSLPVNEGRPQSMELAPGTVQGKWETNIQTGI
jgi:hypothetical protein